MGGTCLVLILFGLLSTSLGAAVSSLNTEARIKRSICPPGQQYDWNSGTCVQEVNPHCTNCDRTRNWVQVLSTDDNGNTLSGVKADLLEAVSKGARIKLRTATYSTELQNCQIINQDVCCQGLLHISYNGWEMFQQKSYWWMINVCTTGNYHMVRYYVGGSYLSETKTKGSFMWYVYRNDDGSYPGPLLSTDSSGNIVRGAVMNVKNAVEEGRSLSVLQNGLALSPIQNVENKDGTVSAQHVWSVSQTKVGNHIEFQPNAYWWFNILTPSGSRDMSRWNLGAHTSRGHTNDIVAMDWFARDCWIKAFTTSTSTILSRLFLISKIEEGASVKVKFGETYLEVDNVIISGYHVSAQVITHLARESATTFKSKLNWELRTLSTTGNIKTYRPLVGSSTMAPEGTTTTSQDITWYYDSRKWDLLFHISNTGAVMFGSETDVRKAVEKGADIRVGYRRAGEPGFRFQTADNINFDSKSSHLSVQLIRLLRDKMVDSSDFEFDAGPVWSFTLLNTKGFMRKTEWVVGEHVNKGRSEERVEIKFFGSP